ncbi:hypothetical protein HKBW3S44_01642 [Candidatus Hakubella thermalkaliphila]|uniref:DUF7718 domain-containing protein n=3 Tax=Candidatus Hakubella thermalkaliphila TaxID=2754717 RepID=A0A6V8NVN6_9ACTN|nr:hypothetical protein [Candidatus Hakubella thermalkaliphila]GFP24113.1 hypothetical protein HKBW3S09_01579 [Candidatus Hakubella thermalkaliphila]GFP31335.1 hypothetical protein HKBW3S34_02255 [Candidatus Hakubella thermalkaliphila]GFP37962.1 hypothetical protein HKBW3S44_01642 [Candidatus Hakubella thermalkaliphila]
MPTQEKWTNRLTHQDRIEVRITKRGKEVLHFSVQYLAEMAGEWKPIMRYDTAHGGPHMDISRPDGTEERRWLKISDPGVALNYAISDIQERWESYRAEYERGRRLK